MAFFLKAPRVRLASQREKDGVVGKRFLHSIAKVRPVGAEHVNVRGLNSRNHWPWQSWSPFPGAAHKASQSASTATPATDVGEVKRFSQCNLKCKDNDLSSILHQNRIDMWLCCDLYCFAFFFFCQVIVAGSRWKKHGMMWVWRIGQQKGELQREKRNINIRL